LKKWLIIGVVLFLIVIIGILFLPSLYDGGISKITPAHDFSAIDENGVRFNLSDYSGGVVILHFTNLESPLCVECLEEMKGQIIELEKLANSNQNVTIITINIRKTLSSETGIVMAERDFEVNVSWLWVEDYKPYPISDLFNSSWMVSGALSNPTIVLINGNQIIVGI
jgi:thiol-disulfide isomerase/thioredoxin